MSAFLKKNGDQWKGLFSPQGRGFPDVAAQDVRYHIFDNNTDALISGTSCSAPFFSALISLLNNARLKANQPPLGFLNPWLYSKALPGLTEYASPTPIRA